MDATLADIYLVSRWNREIILGRPYIYLAVDALTGTTELINTTNNIITAITFFILHFSLNNTKQTATII